MSDLLKDTTKFDWISVQDSLFYLLRDKLVLGPVLKLYDPKVKTKVHCDANKHGLGCMLLQLGGDQQYYLMYAVSKKSTPAEQSYHSRKMELMAVVWTSSCLRPYLLGLPFTVVTDCKAIVHLNKNRTTNTQVENWATLLAEFNFDIRHRLGTQMEHVDALIRAPDQEPTDTEKEIVEKRMEVMMIGDKEAGVVFMQRTGLRLK